MTTPVPEPIVATVVVPLVHEPPPASLNVVLFPAHMGVVPVIAAGSGLTFTDAVTIQLDPAVNVIHPLPLQR